MRGSDILVCSFGVLLLAVVLAIAFSFARPSRFQCFVLRVVLALAAAATAAGIPGFLNFQIGGVLRAGGALGIFVVVYCVTPAETTNSGNRRR